MTSDKKAPFHREKNSINDAILMETYISYVKDKNQVGVRFAFVTHNTKDFSDANGNDKKPHLDFAKNFSKIKSMYFVRLSEALQKFKPALINDLMIEGEWYGEPRKLSEIIEIEEKLTEIIWYDRHQILRSRVESGAIKVVDKIDDGIYSSDRIVKEIWDGAKKAAKKVEKKYGKENLGPWDHFEWGMLNGKLSALRWVMGEEWDDLDT